MRYPADGGPPRAGRESTTSSEDGLDLLKRLHQLMKDRYPESVRDGMDPSLFEGLEEGPVSSSSSSGVMVSGGMPDEVTGLVTDDDREGSGVMGFVEPSNEARPSNDNAVRPSQVGGVPNNDSAVRNGMQQLLSRDSESVPNNDFVTTASGPQVMTSRSQTMASEPQAMTSWPQAMTSGPHAMTSWPQAMTSKPQAMTSKPQAMTSTPQAMTSGIQGIEGTPDNDSSRPFIPTTAAATSAKSTESWSTTTTTTTTVEPLTVPTNTSCKHPIGGTTSLLTTRSPSAEAPDEAVSSESLEPHGRKLRERDESSRYNDLDATPAGLNDLSIADDSSQKEGEFDSNLCCLCDNRINMEFQPCGCRAMCSECYHSRIKKCPSCSVSPSAVD